MQNTRKVEDEDKFCTESKIESKKSTPLNKNSQQISSAQINLILISQSRICSSIWLQSSTVNSLIFRESNYFVTSLVSLQNFFISPMDLSNLVAAGRELLKDGWILYAIIKIVNWLSSFLKKIFLPRYFKSCKLYACSWVEWSSRKFSWQYL